MPQATFATLIRLHIRTSISNRSPIICHCEPFSERREEKAKQSPPTEIAASPSAPRKDRLEESGGQGVEERFVQRVLWVSFSWIPAYAGMTPALRKGVQSQVHAQGLVVDSPQDEGCPPTSKNSLESLFDKEVQQNAAGVWGVPRSPLSSPKSGGQGG